MELPWPGHVHKSVFPVFLPFLGCRERCVFCAQHQQTGQDETNPEKILDNAAYHLRVMGRQYDELAFYGGTFTALKEGDWRLALQFAKNMISAGYFKTFRCSTRPDFLPAERCAELALAGCSLVELGIQTFNESALFRCGRKYGLAACEEAMRLLSENHISIGVQLMPGAPFTQKGQFLLDMRRALDLGAVVFRFYPCLVFARTALERLWRDGQFSPLTVEEAVSECAQAWLMARNGGARVIRMGVAEQNRMEKDILAGPVHEAFGNCVMSMALLRTVAAQLSDAASGLRPKKIFLKAPTYAQGYIWGWQGSLRAAWNALGIGKDQVKFWEKPLLSLEYA